MQRPESEKKTMTMSHHHSPHEGSYKPVPANSLPMGTRMHEYEINAVIGEGGFGIVYLATDTHLGREVAIKEYLPISHAMRQDQYRVLARTPEQQILFDKGLKSFMAEARILAQFRNPNLVEVLRFWEGNGTAYIVMPYYKGKTLRDLLQKGYRVTDRVSLLNIVLPLLNGLEQVHAEGCYHRDISPDNIVILPDGSPLLLDFGAARHEIISQSDSSTVILKPGFAPIEQYGGQETSSQQGPWSDIYALSAVIYQLITGAMPPSSVARIMRDPLVPLAQQASSFHFPLTVLKAIDVGLQVQPQDRPQSIEAFRQLLLVQESPLAAVSDVQRVHQQPLSGSMPPETSVSGVQSVAVTPAAIAMNQGKGRGRSSGWFIGLGLVLFLCVLIVGGVSFWLLKASAPSEAPQHDRAVALNSTDRQILAPRTVRSDSVALDSQIPLAGLAPELLAGHYGGSIQNSEGVQAITVPLPNDGALVDATDSLHPGEALVAEEIVDPVDATEPQGLNPGSELDDAPTPVPTTGTVVVQAQPWGDVYMNGNLVGTTPPSVRLEVPPGRVSIEVRNDSAAPHVQTFNIEAGKTVRMNHSFTQ